MTMTSESVTEKIARWLYSLGLMVMAPVLMAYLLWRSLRQPEYRRHWGERFWGRPDPSLLTLWQKRHVSSTPGDDVLWVHAVSVGETRAAAPLIDAWLTEHPAHRVVLTHTTPTGRATGETLFARWRLPENGEARLVQSYLPYDFFWANHRFLSWAKPRVGALMETELWPNLLQQAKACGVVMLLINARLSARSATRLARFALLARPAINALSGVAAQTDDDAKRLAPWISRQSLPMIVTGNMKFDVEPPQEMLAMGKRWRDSLADRRVWLAASTRDDEEASLLAAWRAAIASGQLDARDLLLIVPRHPQRFDRVAQLISDAGLKCVRRSQEGLAQSLPQSLPIGPHVQVCLGDSLGEMFAYLAASDLVLIGGSIPPLGGQNPIEACVAGKPVFFGPHMFNFSRIARELIRCGAGMQIHSAAEWISHGAVLMQNTSRLQERSLAAQGFAQRHRGASASTKAFMASLWPSGH